jgi:hypothetical protein
MFSLYIQTFHLYVKMSNVSMEGLPLFSTFIIPSWRETGSDHIKKGNDEIITFSEPWNEAWKSDTTERPSLNVITVTKSMK